MDLEMLRNIQDEQEQIHKLYEFFDEDQRLCHSKAGNVEFLTTVKYIEKYLKPKSRILDIGAGTGIYSFYFAKKGYEVSALELADHNIEVFRSKLKPDDSISLRQGNAIDLSMYEDESFDIVLLFGPLYHLHQDLDRKKCLKEAKRVLKPDGKIFTSFISNDMVILTEFYYDVGYFKKNSYDHKSFRVENFPFVFFTVEECRSILKNSDLTILHEVASDGMSELMADQINAMDEESYRQYLRYHAYCCEKKEMLGRSNHLLFVCEKKQV